MAKKQSGSPAKNPSEAGSSAAGSSAAASSAAGSSATPSSSTASGAAAQVPAKKTPWFRFTVMILFGVVYAWDLFAALSNLIGKLDQISQINEVRELNGFPLLDTPWVPLIANLALPILMFLLAIWIARRRNVGILATMLFAGLGVVAAVSLSLIAYVQATS